MKRILAVWLLLITVLLPVLGLAAAETKILSFDYDREGAEPGTATLSFVGDCSIGDALQYRQVDPSFHSVLREKGYDWPFSEVKQYFEQDDLTVANLEVVFTTVTQHADKRFCLIGAPDHAQALVDGGVDLVNTVNNHCMDFLDAGYRESMMTLDRYGVGRFGTVYPNQDDGHDDLFIARVNGISFGFVGFTYPQDYDIGRIEKRIRLLREKGCAVVIVSLHWGRETHMTPEPEQMDYARRVIDAGADMIWGHHPHVIQPIQFYRGKPILYSTGNFTFGTMSEVDPATGIFQVTYETDPDGRVQLKQLRVIPCETRLNPDFRPYELTDQDARRTVFSKLTFKREYKGMENPPASFLDTGIVTFDQGRIVP